MNAEILKHCKKFISTLDYLLQEAIFSKAETELLVELKVDCEEIIRQLKIIWLWKTRIICVECGKEEDVSDFRDILLCDKCMDSFDLDALWADHESNLINALDFNEDIKIRKAYRVK